jgi:hypothetical protein
MIVETKTRELSVFFFISHLVPQVLGSKLTNKPTQHVDKYSHPATKTNKIVFQCVFLHTSLLQKKVYDFKILLEL